MRTGSDDDASTCNRHDLSPVPPSRPPQRPIPIGTSTPWACGSDCPSPGKASSSSPGDPSPPPPPPQVAPPLLADSPGVIVCQTPPPSMAMLSILPNPTTMNGEDLPATTGRTTTMVWQALTRPEEQGTMTAPERLALFCHASEGLWHLEELMQNPRLTPPSGLRSHHHKHTRDGEGQRRGPGAQSRRTDARPVAGVVPETPLRQGGEGHGPPSGGVPLSHADRMQQLPSTDDVQQQQLPGAADTEHPPVAGGGLVEEAAGQQPDSIATQGTQGGEPSPEPLAQKSKCDLRGLAARLIDHGAGLLDIAVSSYDAFVSEELPRIINDLRSASFPRALGEGRGRGMYEFFYSVAACTWSWKLVPVPSSG